VDPVPDLLLLGKSGSAGNRTQDLWICGQELWPLEHRGGPRLVTARLFPVPVTIKCSERTRVSELRGSRCKSDESTGRGIEKWFRGMLPEALWTLVELCCCPGELLWKKCCVSRCRTTYFCAINQFWELFESTCTYRYTYIICTYLLRADFEEVLGWDFWMNLKWF
jgi:hypothetical protein